MAQTGYTPISLYYSATAAATPSAVNLANGELAINITDGKLYYKDNGGVVQLIASKAGASGDVVGPASATDNAIVRFDGTTGKLVQNSVVTIADSTGDISGVGQLNATTLDATNIEVTNIKAKDGTAAASIADSTGVISVTANPVLSGGTANGVLYLNGSKVATSGSALTFDGTNLATTGTTTGSRFITSSTDASGTLLHVSTASTVYGLVGGSTSMGWNAGTQHIYNIGGSEQMRLTSTGLGIGTSSPSTKLHVAGSVANGAVTYLNNTDTANGNGLFIRAGGSNAGKYALAVENAAASSLLVLEASGNLGIGTSSPNSKLSVAAATSTIGSLRVEGTGTGAGTLFAGMTAGSIGFLHSNTGTLAFGTSTTDNNLTERMRLDSSGNLGLGVTPSAWDTATPALQIKERLSLSGYLGNSYVTHNAYLATSGWKYQTSNPVSQFRFADGEFIWNTAPSGTAGNAITFTQAMTLDASGNLGVGTTSPANLLHINGSNSIARFSGASTSLSAYQTFFNNSAAQAYFGIESSTGTGIIGTGAAYGMVLTTASTNPLCFGTNGSERARITSGGDLLVGTTSTGYTDSNDFKWDAPGKYLIVDHASGVASGTGYILFGYGGGGVGSITQNGTTGVLYNITSDYRLKNVIGSVTGSGERIDALEPVDYTWKADGSTARGFLAHKFQEVYPNSVTGNKDAVDDKGEPIYQAMQASSSEVIADLVAEIQSLRQRVALLEGN